MCDDPPPQFGGDICQGVLVEVQMCKGKRRKCKAGEAITTQCSTVRLQSSTETEVCGLTVVESSFK